MSRVILAPVCRQMPRFTTCHQRQKPENNLTFGE
jgi:hypothetical protein